MMACPIADVRLLLSSLQMVGSLTNYYELGLVNHNDAQLRLFRVVSHNCLLVDFESVPLVGRIKVSEKMNRSFTSFQMTPHSPAMFW